MTSQFIHEQFTSTIVQLQLITYYSIGIQAFTLPQNTQLPFQATIYHSISEHSYNNYYVSWLQACTHKENNFVRTKTNKQTLISIITLTHKQLHTNRCKSSVCMNVTLIISPACGHTTLPHVWAAYGDPEACHPVCYQQQRNKETDCSKEGHKYFVILLVTIRYVTKTQLATKLILLHNQLFYNYTYIHSYMYVFLVAIYVQTSNRNIKYIPC